MKRSALLLLLVACCAMASVAQKENIVIEGKVDGIKKGRLYLIARASEEKSDTLGLCDFKRGKFKLEAAVAEPMLAQLMLEGFSGGFTLFVEPGTEYSACLSQGENYYIKGGALNEDYTAHMRKSELMRAEIVALQERYDSLRAGRKFRSASLVNDTLRAKQEQQREFTNNFLSANDNVITAYTVYSNVVMRESGLKEARRMYNSLGEGARASQYGRMLKERVDLMAKTDEGAKAPDFYLPGADGNEIKMSAVEGKIKIIDFWASWCGPCRLNNPALKKLYDEYHEKGLEIIGVSLDTDKAAWQKAIEKDGLVWVNVSSLKGWDCEVVRLYNIKGVPSLFILDEYNNIIATGLRGEQLRTFLQENLK